METRVAVISIIVENSETVEKLNGLLHDYGQAIEEIRQEALKKKIYRRDLTRIFG